jgi:hypothetical protein
MDIAWDLAILFIILYDSTIPKRNFKKHFILKTLAFLAKFHGVTSAII